MQNALILAIDLGTSGPKVALFTWRGELVGYEYEATPYYLFPNGGAEQKPSEWWAAITAATRRLMKRDLAPPEQIAALSCTTQWSGTVAVDRSGEPLMDAVIWMDARGAPYVQEVVGGPVRVEGYGLDKLLTWLRLTGGVPNRTGKDSIGHILYIQREHPHVYAQTHKFLEPKDYLNLRLTGKFAASYDSITLHWVTDNRNLSRVDYSARLLRMTGIEREKLPDLVPPAGILGELQAEAAADLGLPPGIPVAVGTPDLQSAALGAGAAADFQAYLYVGTSSWIACHVPFKKTDILHNIASLPAGIPGKYLVSNEQQTSGACLNFLRDNILYHQDELLTQEGVPDVYQIFDRIAGKAPAGSGGLIFTPWLYGERTPVSDRTLRGGLHNLSLESTREHIIRAVFEGVAFNTRWLLGYVEQFVGRRLDALPLVGGGGKSGVWCQIFADILGRSVRQVKDPILANARGAAFQAAAALGMLKLEEIEGNIVRTETFSPNPGHQQVYNEMYREFLEIYKQNTKIYSRLNHRVAGDQVKQ